MTHLVTRTQLARVTQLSHRPKPLFFTPKPTLYRSQTLSLPQLSTQETCSSCRASPLPKAASATFTWSAPLMSPRYFVLVVWNQVLGFLALHIVTVFSHNENLGFLFSFLCIRFNRNCCCVIFRRMHGCVLSSSY